MEYKSTYPFTPYAPGVDPMNDLSNPDWANYAMEQKRRKLQDDLKNKAQGNPALDERLPKKFVPSKDANSVMQQPSQNMPKKPRSSKIKDEGLIPTRLPSFVKSQPNEEIGFNLQTPETPDMVLPPVLGQYDRPAQDFAPESLAPQQSAIRNNVAGFIPNEPRPMGAGSMPEQPQGDIDFRSKLYEYLRKKISGDPMDADRLARMGQARDYAAANQFGASLADSASKMGTLQGKRSEVGNFQPLIDSIYQRDMGKVGDELALEKQREDSLLKGASLSSKILRSTGPKPPKILPYYKPPTEEQPGEILMYDEEGNLMPRQLPPGYEPNNPWSTLPMFMDAKGNPVIIERNPVTGQTRQLPIPDNLKSIEQAKMEANNVMRKIDLDLKVAGEQRRGELMREQVRYQQYLAELRQKELELKIRAQAEKERSNKTNEQIKKDKGASSTGKEGGKITEAQAKTAVQSNVALDALTELEGIESKGYQPGIGAIAKDAVGAISPVAKNYVTSETEQLYENATDALVGQLLRFESGAVLGRDEIKRQLKLYALQPGDKPGTKAQKNRMRRIYVQSLIEKSGPAGSGMELPQQQTPKKVKRKFHDKANNRTKFIYDDNSEEVVNGLK